MEKRLLLTLAILGAFVFTGCNSKKSDKPTTKEDTTTKETVIPPNLEYEQNNTIKHEYVRDANYNILSLVSSYKGEGDTNYKYYEKQEMEYNSSNQIVTHTWYSYNTETNEWVGSYKCESTYNSNNEDVTDIEYYFNEETNTFEIDMKTDWFYTNGKKTSYIYYDYKEGEFVPTSKFFYTYEGDKVVEDVRINWSTSTESWINDRKYVYSFEGEKQVSFVHYKGDGDSWKKYAKGEFEFYPGTNNKKTYTWSLWKESTSTYSPRSKSIYEYDSFGFVSVHISQNYLGGEWVNYSKYENTYFYADCDTSDSINYSYNGTTSSWEKSYRTYYVFDKYGTCALQLDYEWDKITETWVIVDLT